MQHLRLSLAVISLLSLGLAACGSDTGEETVSELAVTGTESLEFVPDSYTVAAGTEITLEFTAEDAVEHDFVIEGAAEAGSVAEDENGEHGDDSTTDGADLHVGHVDAGQTVTTTFTINDAGTYEVYCSVPGHREAGMVATLTVTTD